jgi:hypothetical protein
VLGPDGILQRAGGGAEYQFNDEVCFNDPPRFTPLDSP